ncbi:MAG: redoxin domain-containing protein [Planctomycetes bacterium]|nr:redoxin domain-containing protein [Planctomycetota bacterium]
MTRRSGLKLLAAVFGMAAVLMWSGRLTAEDKKEGKAEIGKPAPAFTLKTPDGKEHSLAEYKGKIVVIHFHSVNCPWAKAYQPILSADARKFADKNVVFLGINSNHTETADEIKKDSEKLNLPYPILIDKGNVVADDYGARFTPHIYVIDGDGVLRYKGGIEKAPNSPGGAGKSDEQYLVPVVQALVEGKEPPYTSEAPIGCGIKREKK